MDEIVCRRCRAHGAPDACWNCGRRKRATVNEYGRTVPADPLPAAQR